MIQKYLIFVFFVITLQSQPLWAQTNIRSIPLPTGSGARALGQGGAFIAIVDDATAASWNPAGLINLERPEFSIVGAYLSTDQDFSVDPSVLPGISMGDEDVSRWDLNFLSAAYPFLFFNKNVVFALNYHQTSDFHFDLSIDQSVPGRSFDLNQDINFKSSGGIGALSPALSILLAPNFSIGITVNIYDDEFFNAYAWKESNTITGIGTRSNGSQFSTFARTKTSSRDYHGLNVSLGMLWDVWKKENKRLTFGAVLHTPYRARFDQETKKISNDTFNGFKLPTIEESDSRVKLDWPMSIGLGLGYRYSNALSFALDFTWTDWSEWVQRTKTTSIDDSGNSFRKPSEHSRPVGGGSEHDDIDDTYSLRFGTEYLIMRERDIIALRGGAFYEPRASLGAPTAFAEDEFGRNVPIDFDGDPTEVWGFSLGVGYSTKRFSLDAAYQFRYIRDMEGQDIGLTGTSLDAIENMFLTSLIVYF